jgi:hypothetical protein
MPMPAEPQPKHNTRTQTSVLEQTNIPTDDQPDKLADTRSARACQASVRAWPAGRAATRAAADRLMAPAHIKSVDTSQMLRGQSGLVFWSAWSQLKVRGRAGATAEQTICSSQGSTRPGLDAARAGNGTPPTRFPHTSLHLTLGGRSQGLSLCRVSDRFCSLLCLCWWQPSLWQPAWPTRLPPRLATRCQQSMAGT